MRKISSSFRTIVAIALLNIGLLLISGSLSHVVLAVQMNSVVGNGTPASCDSNALAAAIAGGGTITFNCGGTPHTILADTYVINGNVDIDGGNQITLDGEGLRQLFLVQEGASLTLRNIILQNGFADNGPGGAVRSFGTVLIQNSTLRENGTDTVWAGGALANDTTGVMTVESSTLEGNSAADGAAIYTSGPSLTVRNSEIRDNYTRDNGGFYGGAILQAHNPDGLVTIDESTLEGNQSNPNGSVGGAISLWSGQLKMEGSLAANNLGYGGGGAIYAAQGVTTAIHGSILSENQTLLEGNAGPYLGGAILNHGVLLIEDSTIHSNRAADGAGIYSGGENSSLTLSRSTVAHNVATGGGGGLMLASGENVVDNSTLTDNSADIGGGIRSDIAVGQGALTLSHVTLFGNSAETTSASLYADNGSQPVSVANSILANPRFTANCNDGAALTSGGYNVADDDSCALSSVGDQQNVDPQLGPLADNGGPTTTHLPWAGSPALDTIPGNCAATDQRGVVRPSGVGCDSGSVEVEVDALPTSTSTPTATGTPVLTATPTPTGTPVPIVQTFHIPPVARLIPVRYPLNALEIFNPDFNRFVLTRTIDFEICLYRKDLSSSLSSGRAPYERAIRFMADAIYEMTNGAHLLGEVTIFYNCTDLATEMVWVDRVWPNATLNGYGNDLGSHVAMGDTFTFPTPYAALQSGNERGTGYTMAHEWGHYFYGVDDQYANTAVDARGTPTAPCDTAVTYQGPCASDMPVNPSVMTNQWNAAAGNYAWLNFSIAANETNRNRNWRVYQADNWTTLTRTSDNDPQAIYTSRTFNRRNYFSELGLFAPSGTAAPRLDLPANDSDLATGIARSQLKITWRDRQSSGDGLPQFKPNIDPLHMCLSCPVRLNWENKFVYPDAALFNVQLRRELPIAGMNVAARLTSPSGSTSNVPLNDADGTGNYQAALPYDSGGEYQVSFVFTNPDNTAVETNAGLDYTPSLDGESAPLRLEPVNQPFTITASTIFTVTDFALDDHANDITSATVLTPTNASTAGRIDRAGDVDVFAFTVNRTGDFVVRITDLALGTQPRIAGQRGDGLALFQTAWSPLQPYLFARFTAVAGQSVTIHVSDVRSIAYGGHYRISAGPPLAGEGGAQRTYLPLIRG